MKILIISLLISCASVVYLAVQEKVLNIIAIGGHH